MSLPNLQTKLSPTEPRYNVEKLDRLPGIVILVSDTVIEHYWATIRRKLRRRNTTDRKNRRILGWDGLIYLGKKIERVCQSDPCWKTIQGGVSINAIVDAFMRAVPQYEVTRPRFLSTLHFLFGLKVAPEVETINDKSSKSSSFVDREKRKIDCKLLAAVENYFDGFDLDKTGVIDWRDLVCRLHPLFLPMKTPQQHYIFCFDLFTADQHFDKKNSTIRSLSIDKVCHLFGLYATTEIYELILFDIGRRAYDQLPIVLKNIKPSTGLPIITSIAFREMLTVEMTDSARERRSQSARTIALKKQNNNYNDDDDDGLGSSNSEYSTSESDSDTELGAVRKTTAKRYKRQNVKHVQKVSPWAMKKKNIKKRGERVQKVRPTLGFLMAPTRDVAMKGPHRLVTTYNLEESEFFNKWLHPLCIKVRTDLDNISKLRNFVNRWKAVKRIKVLEEWKYWSWRRKRLREIIIPASKRFYIRNTTICMFAMKIGAVQECSSIIIQRTFRGHLYGREQAHFIRYQIKHANKLQKWWVKKFSIIMWMRRLIRRSRCAKLLQRMIRGYLGRCRARKKLILHYEQEWEKILEERARIKARHENNAATFLQARYRGMMDRSYYNQLLIEKRAKEMEEEMEKTRETEETRRMRLYQQQLREYWAEQKRLIETKIEREQYDYQAQWELKVAKLKRRWQRESLVLQEEKEEREERQRQQDLKWEEDWKFKIESGGVQEAARVLVLYETGGSNNQKDKDKSKVIRILINSQTAEIKQKFRSSGVPLTDANAKVKAKIIAQETYAKAARAKLEKQREEDRVEVALQRQLKWEAEQKRNGNLNEQKRKHALHIIQGNVRKYRARQEVKRRIRFNYRKEFDVEYNVFFYKHRNNGTFRWDKPKLLGRSDLPAPKRWYHIRDSSFEPGASYWLKPSTAEMTFDLHSFKFTMCDKHINEFATHYCVDCTTYDCESCHLGKNSKTDNDPNVPVNSNGPSGNTLISHRKHNTIELECGIERKELPVSCASCNIMLPNGNCVDCSTLYCNVCFKSYHKNEDYPEYANHSMVLLDENTQEIVDEIKRLRDEERYSHV